MSSDSKPCATEVSRRALREWFNTPSGRQLQQLEARLIGDTLTMSYCQTALQTGVLGWERAFVKPELYPNYCLLDRDFLRCLEMPYFRALMHELPIASESVDYIISPHFLEFEAPALRPLFFKEAERALRPEGRLLIILFNSFSAYPILRMIPGLRRFAPIPCGLVSMFHILHWMAPYNLAIESNVQFCLPLRRIWQNRSALTQVSTGLLVVAYAVTAVKRTPALLPPPQPLLQRLDDPGFIPATGSIAVTPYRPQPDE